jgi:predicted type IV restriction endonuclease
VGVPDKIQELVERFHSNREGYRSGNYNETQVRREFIDPFFVALGWDVDNSKGFSEIYKDVIHEDAIKIDGKTKAPDYSFRVGGERKFFLEAKKPTVNIRNDSAPAFQVRRYGWSAKLPISILTDFEEFSVYNCFVKPDSNDRPEIARDSYFKYEEYIEKWDQIKDQFSKEAVYHGSLNKYAESLQSRRGVNTVDSAFLKEIESWREILAVNISLKNPSLSRRDLNAAVQKTIDRIIFLRICEDRVIEPYGALRDVGMGDDTYRRLGKLFERADDRYNSGLFHFNHEKSRPEDADTFTLGLKIDDKPLKKILNGLYYPQCPYEFSVLPPDILGQVYEQFLGKVIHFTDGHEVIVEEKPEVKRAGGVYYTPTYIVKYIVENTIGKLLENKTPTEVAGKGKTPPLRILDPACGSGSFLIEAYQFLLDWHLKWYTENEPEKFAKGRSAKIYRDQSGSWRLTTDERKRIVVNNIYGVDIDSQAIEVTKLSLLLKVLEGESQATINENMRLFQERVLPDLATNIRCGNSLISSDFYENFQGDLGLLDDETRLKINVFDWKDEFREVFRNGGFDTVVGNPPYGFMMSSYEQDYFNRMYKEQDYQKDFYLLFLEKYKLFLKSDGYLGVIVSNTWLQSLTLRKIRSFLTTQYSWERILYLPEPIFNAVVDTHVLVFRNSVVNANTNIVVDVQKGKVIEKLHELPMTVIPTNGDPINIVQSLTGQTLQKKIIQNSQPLETFCSVFNGVKPFEKGKGRPAQTSETMKTKPFVVEGERPDDSWSPLLRGSLIHRYQLLWAEDYWIKYGPWLAAPRDPSIFQAPQKIMVRQTGDSIIATFVKANFIARNNLHILLMIGGDYSLLYILGILNSRLIDFAYSNINPEKGEALAEVKKNHVEQLPIMSVDFSKKAEVKRYERIVSLVKIMLELNEKLKPVRENQQKVVLERQIVSVNYQIDQLVYELYDLTEEEIALVEGKQN